jgi:hypothetical protein
VAVEVRGEGVEDPWMALLDRHGLRHPPGEATTDQDGRLVLAGVEPGDYTVLCAAAGTAVAYGEVAGLESREVRRLSIEPGRDGRALVVQVTEGAWGRGDVCVTARDAAGRPVISRERPGGLVDDAGRISYGRLAPGAHAVAVWSRTQELFRTCVEMTGDPGTTVLQIDLGSGEHRVTDRST